jgi:hypothetical protein
MDTEIPLPDKPDEDKRNGRPPADIDSTELQALCRIHATNEEIAAHFNVSVRTIQRLKKNPAFAEFVARGRADGKISLRRAQWKNALGGNVTMQIWLGKQELNQRDRHEITGANGGPISIREMLETMTDEEYEALAREANVDLPAEGDPPLAGS